MNVENRQESTFNAVTKERFTSVEPITRRPARVFGQPEGQAQQPEWTNTVYSLSVTAISLVLPEHNHVLFDNIGVNLIQFSTDNFTFTDFLEVGKAYVLDFHTHKKLFYLRTNAGTGILRIQTW